MRAPSAIAVLLLASCAPRSYRLIRIEPQLRLVPPKGVPVARAPTPVEAHRARYGPYAQNGFVDLRAGLVLKAVTPVLPAGETLSNEIADSKPGEVTVRSNVIGFATAFYSVEAAGDKVSLRFRGGEQSIRGVSSPIAAPPIPLDSRAAHWRLFFLVRESGDDRDITLVSAPSPAALHRLACREPGISCVKAPRGVAFSAQVEIEYNGRKLLRPLGATVGELVRSEQGEGAVTLERLWRGKLAPVQSIAARDLLGVPLAGGDRVVVR